MKMESTDNTALFKAAERFAALGSEQRLQVLRLIVRAGGDGLTVGQLGERTGITGSTLTHHLKILNHAGLIGQSKQGRSILCVAAAYDEVRDLSDYLLAECCADADQPDEGHGH